MNYFFTDEQIMIKELASKIAREKIAPVALRYDEEEKYPYDIVKILVEAGLWGVYIPEEYGGFGGGMLETAIVNEELSKACGAIDMAFGATVLGVYPIVLFGTEKQKQKYLPEVASGKIGAFGLTEASAGSDAASLETKAVQDGGDYILNGTKLWISNAGDAEIYLVIARTSAEKGTRGLSAFIVEKDTPGFSFGKKENKMGMKASSTRELIFADCRVPKENMLGEPGTGFKVAMSALDRTRPAGVAAQALGIAQGAFDAALKFSTERVQFGQTISSFQGIQFMLADMKIQIEATRSLVYQICRYIDSGAKDIALEASIAKVMASDTAMKVTTDAVQIMGGAGYMKEYPVEKMMRDAKVTQIYEGTNQIQRTVIARELLKDMAGK